MLTVQELNKLTIKELDAELKKATQDLFKIRFEVKTGSSKANHEIRKLRKYRAQIKTIKNGLEVDEKAKFEAQKEVSGANAELSGANEVSEAKK